MTTHVNNMSAAKKPSDPWSGDLTGCGGFLTQMAFEEANILQQIGSMQTEITANSMTAWQKMMSESADLQKASIQKDADEVQFQAIQAGVSAGMTGVSGAAMLKSSFGNADLNEAQGNLKSLETTNKALAEHIEKPDVLKAEEAPGDEEMKSAEERELARQESQRALETMQRNSFKDVQATEIEKLSKSDAAKAQAELKDAIKTATTRVQIETDKMMDSTRKWETGAQFANNTTSAVVQGFYIHAVKEEKAALQAAATRTSASADVWKQASQTNSQNATEVMRNREQMQAQVMQAIREGTRN